MVENAPFFVELDYSRAQPVGLNLIEREQKVLVSRIDPGSASAEVLQAGDWIRFVDAIEVKDMAVARVLIIRSLAVSAASLAVRIPCACTVSEVQQGCAARGASA